MLNLVVCEVTTLL